MGRGRRALIRLAALAALAAGCRAPSGAPVGPTAARSGWLKGQTHLHSANSPDSRTPPEEVARWYEQHGFDFVVFTDHDFVTALPSTPRMLVIPGAELTQNLPTCDPPPDDPSFKCKLHV